MRNINQNMRPQNQNMSTNLNNINPSQNVPQKNQNLRNLQDQQINQRENTLIREQLKKSLNNAKENENPNVEIVTEHQEKSVVILPGQTYEPKTITETFENPVEETILNEDGTKTTIIRQTKITTIIENVPIEKDKINAIEGLPQLPMIKQLITYEYKTISSNKNDLINLINQKGDTLFNEGMLNQNNYNNVPIENNANANQNNYLDQQKLRYPGQADLKNKMPGNNLYQDKNMIQKDIQSNGLFGENKFGKVYEEDKKDKLFINNQERENSQENNDEEEENVQIIFIFNAFYLL
jgi:hypothetical protein